MNSIYLIQPYRFNGRGAWCFDDDRVGLKSEPFVGGASEAIDKMLESAGLQQTNPFGLYFSHIPFPGSIAFNLIEEESGEFGSYYYWPEKEWKFYLCPALFKYYPEAPKVLYGKVE